MLCTQAFGQELKKAGYTFYSGVPCSFLKDLINYAINDCQYIGAANEGDAVAACAGAHLGGEKAVVLLQNSGLGNTVSPLTSLIYTFQIPILGIVSLRGETGIPDEPQHELMGQITTQLLDTMRIDWEYLATDMDTAKQQLQKATQLHHKNKSFFFVVKKGTFDTVKLKDQNQKHATHATIQTDTPSANHPSRIDALQTIVTCETSDTVVLATTGKTGRELYEVNDLPNHLYQVGSMGCISMLGLGLALCRPDKQIIVIDGDGAALMRLGNLATIGHYAPPNLLHILLDNGTHDSTGGQQTVSTTTNFPQIAAACSYPSVIQAHSTETLKTAITRFQKNQRLTFIHCPIQPGSKKELGRPGIKPHEVKERLLHFLNKSIPQQA